jgi:hypothetical protein
MQVGDNLFRSSKLEVDIGGVDWLLVTCRTHSLCRIVNDLVKKYLDVQFRQGDEAQFKVPTRDAEAVLTAIGLKHKVFAYLRLLAV